MRILSFVAALLGVSVLTGCMSCTSYPTPIPIVGDSMSQFSADAVPCGGCGTAGCGGQCIAKLRAMLAAHGGSPAFYSDFGQQDCIHSCGGDCGSGGCGPGGCGMGGAACGPGGCGPGGCGLGHGALAGALAGGCGPMGCGLGHGGVAAAIEARAMSNPCVAKIAAHAQRSCAYGKCGGSLGPQQGQVTFPYYTVRGPRDFLNPNPPNIGP